MIRNSDVCNLIFFHERGEVYNSSVAGEDRASENRKTHLSQADCEYRDSCVVFLKNGRINSEDRLVSMLAELSRLSWDFVCFSDTRVEGDNKLLSGGHRLLYY